MARSPEKANRQRSLGARSADAKRVRTSRRRRKPCADGLAKLATVAIPEVQIEGAGPSAFFGAPSLDLDAADTATAQKVDAGPPATFEGTEEDPDLDAARIAPPQSITLDAQSLSAGRSATCEAPEEHPEPERACSAPFEPTTPEVQVHGAGPSAAREAPEAPREHEATCSTPSEPERTPEAPTVESEEPQAPESPPSPTLGQHGCSDEQQAQEPPPTRSMPAKLDLCRSSAPVRDPEEETPPASTTARGEPPPVPTALLQRSSSSPDMNGTSSAQAEGLDERLRRCERELARLQRSLDEQVEWVRDSKRGVLRPAISDAAPGSLEEWKAEAWQLLARLQHLSADALECSCDRTSGAMDVYGATGTAVDQMASLLSRHSDATLEASAPPGCDPVEWRIVERGSTSSEEVQALRKLLSRMADAAAREARQPITLLRFLRAQEGRAATAEDMLKTSLSWRDGYRISVRSARWQAEERLAKTWRSQLVRKYAVHKVVATDCLGLPVYLFRWSVFDVAGAERELGFEFVIRIILCIHEELAVAMRKSALQHERVVPGCMFIWDIGNYGGRHGVSNYMGRMWSLLRFLPKVTKLLESNYPEVVRKIMVVRSGPATRAIYNAALPFLPSRTLGKCRIYGWRASEWLKDLRAELPAQACEQLPAFLLREDDDALAKAEPPGGMYPPGAAAAARAAAGAESESSDRSCATE